MALTKVSGSVLKNPLSLSGNVSVGGTLTYEDVTNVDSVGVITARSGINITGGDLKIGGNTVINSGRALYNVEQVKLADSKELILGSGNDLKIYHSGSHSFIDEVGNGALKIKGDDIRFENASGTEAARIDNNGKVLIATDTTSEAHANNDELIIGKTTDDANHGLTIVTPSNRYGTVAFSDGSGGTGRGLLEYNHSTDFFRIYVAGGEKLRITSGGDVGIGTNSPQSAGLTVLRNSEARLQVWANGDGSNGKIALRADGTNTQMGTWSNHDCHLVRNASIQATISSTGISLPAGKGIDFSATSDATGMTSELFDDYERGVHVISVTGSSGNPSVNLSANHKKLYYTKIGGMVHVTGELRWTINSHGSGDLRITLPFQSDSSTSSNSHGTAQTWNVNWAWRSETRDIWSEVHPGQSFLVFRLGGSGSLHEDFLQLGSTYQHTSNSGYGVEYQVSLWYRTG